jgi:hypothetical protein
MRQKKVKNTSRVSRTYAILMQLGFDARCAELLSEPILISQTVL